MSTGIDNSMFLLLSNLNGDARLRHRPLPRPIRQERRRPIARRSLRALRPIV